MAKKYILGILFFSGLWGLSEALLGGYLYKIQATYSSVPLTVIAFVILTVACFYMPKVGVAAAIAICAMMYKFFNQPLFACHLLGIAILGICYDVFFNALRINSKSLSAFAAALVNYTLFALMMRYVTNNGFWDSTKMINHIAEGVIAAAACAIIVPIVFRIVENINSKAELKPVSWKPAPAISLGIIAVVWGFSFVSLAMYVLRSAA